MRTTIVFQGPLKGRTLLIRNRWLFKNGVLDVSEESDEDQKKIAHYMQTCYQTKVVRQAEAGDEISPPEVIDAPTQTAPSVPGNGGQQAPAAQQPAPSGANAGTAAAVTAGSGNEGQRSGAGPRH